MADENYWRKFERRRLTRRQLLRVATLSAAGITATAVIGCGDEQREEAATATPTTATGTTTGTATPATGTPQRGGAIKASSDLATFDTWDPHRSRFGPADAFMGLIFNKVVRYRKIEEDLIEGDLALEWEQPDDMTYIFTFPDNIKWQDRPPVSGRQFTAEDVKYNVERIIAGIGPDGQPDGRFFRKSLYAVTDRIEVVDQSTIKFVTKNPDATYLATYAGPWQYLIAPEAVERFGNDIEKFPNIIGTGPFTIEVWDQQTEARFVRNPNYFRSGLPYVESVSYFNLRDPATIEASYRNQQIYFASLPKPVMDGLYSDFPNHPQPQWATGFPFLQTFIMDRPPYNDIRLVKAIHLAIDRFRLIDTLYFGLAKPSPLGVPWVLTAWALPQEELLKLPGYRPSGQGREQDMAQAKELFDMAGGPGLGTLEVVVPDVIEATYAGFAATVKEMLERTLGGSFTTPIRTYAQITQGLVDRSLPTFIGVGNAPSAGDPTGVLYRAYHSQGSENNGKSSDPEVDSLLEEAVRTLDRTRRIEIVRRVQRIFIERPPWVVSYLNGINLGIHWPFYKNIELAFAWNGWQIQERWLDQKDASYRA